MRTRRTRSGGRRKRLRPRLLPILTFLRKIDDDDDDDDDKDDKDQKSPSGCWDILLSSFFRLYSRMEAPETRMQGTACYSNLVHFLDDPC